jgi:methylthioribose-1-phosphate isomerase
MKVDGIPYRSIWRDGNGVGIIDQTRLPFDFHTLRLESIEQVAHAIRSMQVRGAPLIGATAAYGIALAMAQDSSDANLEHSAAMLAATRPTAVNLRWAIERLLARISPVVPASRSQAAWNEAEAIAAQDIALNLAIGGHGTSLLRAVAHRKGRVNVLTHCNAGWLATVDVGTALAPIYLAHDQGIPVHVWVDETRPRNQGLLTAWELSRHGVPNTLIADNAGGHLMQHGEVDMVLVGADRVSARGDVCNKIGTYLKALAAKDCGVPFYAAVPGPTIDWSVADALKEIPIEQRGQEEMLLVQGRTSDGRLDKVRIGAEGMTAANPAFDVTPARLVTAIITDRGIAPATREGLAGLYRDKAA